MNYRKLLQEGTALLEAHEVPDAGYDAWALLSYVFHMDRGHYLLEQSSECEDPEGIARYEELLKERAKRVPLQQILGSAPFMHYEFFVNEHVLTPRADTEVLVEDAFMQLKLASILHPGTTLQVLDMCTGSGCIAISIHCMGKEQGIPLQVEAVDLSEEALSVAARNNDALAAGEVKLIHSDMFTALPSEKRYDMILSNPPYIPTAECETLMPEVREHEPRMALDGSEDGLKFYRILAEEGWERLNAGGQLWMEIGYDQGPALQSMLEEQGFSQVRILKDLAGLDRVATGRKS